MQHIIAKIIVSAVFAATTIIMSPAMAQAYPNKPLKLIVPTAPGGGYDTVGRLLSERLAIELGQAIVVENRAGSGGVIGTQAAAQAAPDGYTLLVGGLANLAFNQSLYEKLPYNAATAFVPIALVGSFSYALVGRKDLPQSTLREVIDFARANPGKLTIATAGTGTGQHIAAALLKNLAKVDITEVPYKGAQPAYADIFGDRVDLFFDNTATMRPFLEAGRIKAFAISSPTRDPLVPQVPTVKEAGIDGLVLESWIGLFAPAKTPQPVIDKLRSALAKTVESGDLASRFGALGIRTVSMTPKDTEIYVKAEIDKWPRFFQQAGIKTE